MENRKKRWVLVGGCSVLMLILFVTLFDSSPTDLPEQLVPVQSRDTVQVKHFNEQENPNSKPEDILVTTTDILDAQIPLHNYTDHAVHKYVQRAINRMYIDLMNNGELINDDVSSEYPVIPNYFHYIRFNQSHMKFAEMLSIKSVLKNANPQKIIIHTNTPIRGKYWEMVQDDPAVQIKMIQPPKDIFGRRIGWVQHASDLARIQILLKFGGIYLDNDCLVINEFERLRKHHCVVSKSSEERNMGNMVLMGVKGCPFFKLVEELYRIDYEADKWYYNGGDLPQYAILDQFPGIAFLADEGVQQGMLYLLFGSDTEVSYMLKYWRIIHLFYGHKDYTYNDTTDYNTEIIKTTRNGFSRLARWILFDHEEPYEPDEVGYPDGELSS